MADTNIQSDQINPSAKYYQVGDKYYTDQTQANPNGGQGTLFTQITPDQILSRAGQPIDPQSDWHKTLGVQKLGPDRLNDLLEVKRGQNVQINDTIPQNTETVAGNPLAPGRNTPTNSSGYDTSGNLVPLNQSKYEQGFNSANASGGYTRNTNGDIYDANGNHVEMKDLPKGADGKPLTNLETLPLQGRDVVDKNVPQNQGQNEKINNLYNTDPVMSQLIQSWKDYSNPANQQTSLVDSYNKMAQSAALPALNTQLLDMQKIISGTENDIRKEVMASGSGLATESQVVALSHSRNAQLIKDYNALLQTRNGVQKNIDSMIGLEEKDRQAARDTFDKSFNMGLKIADYQQKMSQNSISAFDRVRKSIGWDGIWQSVKDDPIATQLIEKTYGLPTGALQRAAEQEQQTKQGAQLKAQLENTKLQAQINNLGGKKVNKSSGVSIPTVLTPYLRTSSNGTNYAYLGDLSPNSKEKYANIASENGLKVIMDKNVGNDLNNIKDANAKLDTIGGIMDHLTSPGPLSRFLYGVGASKFATVFQTNPEKAAAGTLNDVALDLLKAISGVQGFRGNQTAVQQVRDNLPSIYDTKDVSNKKIEFVRKLISDRENALVGTNKNPTNTGLNQTSQDILKKYGIQ